MSTSFRPLMASIVAMLVAVGYAQDVVVRPGDNLWSLAQRHDTTVEALMKANGLVQQNLMPGDVLTLPSGSIVDPTTYVVQPGDTLYDIAVAFSISVDDLIAFNGLDGSLIRVGQTLALRPNSGTPTPDPLVVTVRPGDNLWAIARQHDVTVEAIINANSITAGTVLHPGDTLTVPGRYGGSAPVAAQGGPLPPSITVQRGDNLYQIARQHNTTVPALMSLNNLRDTNLHVGQTLRVVPSSELMPAAVAATPAPQPQPAPQPTPQPQAAAATPSMVWPLRGPITSRFGYRQLRINGSNYHSGLDIDGNVGDPIVSATAGVVTFSGWRGGYGNLVIVERNGVEYFYAHASKLVVATGATVKPGQLIAHVGTTGAVTGPHLHFEVRVNGNPVDPLPMLEQHAGRP